MSKSLLRLISKFARPLNGWPSPNEVAAGADLLGGWSKATLLSWGVPYPPPKGWRNVLHSLWMSDRGGLKSERPKPRKGKDEPRVYTSSFWMRQKFGPASEVRKIDPKSYTGT